MVFTEKTLQSDQLKVTLLVTLLLSRNIWVWGVSLHFCFDLPWWCSCRTVAHRHVQWLLTVTQQLRKPASSVKSGVCQQDKGWIWFKPIVCHINVWLSCSVSRADDEGTFCGSVWRLINKPTNRWTDILESALTPKEGVSEASKTDRNEFCNKYSGIIHQSSFAVIYWSFLSLSSLVSASLSPPPSSHTPADSICTW